MSALSSAPHVVAATIDVGTHETVKLFGLTWNWDTILTSVVAGLILVALGFYIRRGAERGVPTKIQLTFELIVDTINKQVEESMGIKVAPFVVPLAVALFVFILLCNWLAVIPSGHPEHFPAPTADVNLTFVLAFFVIIPMHFVSLRRRGAKKYVKHYFQPYWWLFPINLIEEITKPITLALRLFGNIFSGAIMVSLLALLPWFALWFPQAIWKPFDMAIGLIQALIFALLTILYYGFATAVEEH